jgi:hypothetical protein
MHSKPWIIITIGLCLVFGLLAFPIFLRTRGLFIAGLYTLVAWAVIWLAYLVRAWVFSHPEFRKDRGADA